MVESTDKKLPSKVPDGHGLHWALGIAGTLIVTSAMLVWPHVVRPAPMASSTSIGNGSRHDEGPCDTSAPSCARGIGGAEGLAALPEEPTRCLGQWRMCSIVSTAGVLLQGRAGTLIDQSDAVIRVGLGPTRGYEAMVGARTDVRYLANTFVRRKRHVSAAFVHKLLRHEPGITFLWFSNDGKQCRSSYWGLQACHPAVNFCAVMNPMAAAQSCLPGGSVPTSGFIALFALLVSGACRSARLFGFTDPPSNTTAVPYHYYASGAAETDHSLSAHMQRLATFRARGQRVHSFEEEHAWLRRFGQPARCHKESTEQLVSCAPQAPTEQHQPPAFIEVTGSAMRAHCRTRDSGNRLLRRIHLKGPPSRARGERHDCNGSFFPLCD
mmetsp:Transcript_14233/g.36861  ORF Transcript_14233/g.36861 Transcript_14233/m.36861 type:complete len:382 (-) Transcript_14233:71-1216(-)